MPSTPITLILNSISFLSAEFSPIAVCSWVEPLLNSRSGNSFDEVSTLVFAKARARKMLDAPPRTRSSACAIAPYCRSSLQVELRRTETTALTAILPVDLPHDFRPPVHAIGSTVSAFSGGNGVHVVGIGSTIDNDLFGTDITIGCDTAINVTLGAIDYLRTTGSSDNRAFLVETMGRDCVNGAIMAGLAGGAEVISTPEFEVSASEIAQRLRAASAVRRMQSW
jgi:6-phosphofructokinase